MQRTAMLFVMLIFALLLTFSTSVQALDGQHTTPIFAAVDCATFELAPDEHLECGYVTVPEDRSKPEGNQVQLAVAVARAYGEQTRPDPIFHLDGGPGGSSLWPGLNPRRALTTINRERDIIMFDQRGIHWSQPALTCDAYHGQSSDDANFYDALYACRDDWLDAGIDLDMYNTTNSAADIEDIRIALGYDEINLWGISYGTMLGLTAMRYQPDHIRSVTLDSVFPPHVAAAEQTPAAIDATYNRVFAACAADDECAERFPDVASTFYETVALLDATPGTFFNREVTSNDFVATLMGLIDEPDTIKNIPGLIDQVSNEAYNAIGGSAIGDPLGGNVIMTYSVMCQDSAPLDDLATVEAVIDAYPYTRVFMETNFFWGLPMFEICQNWPVTPSDPAFFEPPDSPLPTLVLAGDVDPRTPVAWSRDTAALLPNATYFEVPLYGHAIIRHRCASTVMEAFLNDPGGDVDPGCLTETPDVRWNVR